MRSWLNANPWFKELVSKTAFFQGKLLPQKGFRRVSFKKR
jgi:hypothetical protein